MNRYDYILQVGTYNYESLFNYYDDNAYYMFSLSIVVAYIKQATWLAIMII